MQQAIVRPVGFDPAAGFSGILLHKKHKMSFDCYQTSSQSNPAWAFETAQEVKHEELSHISSYWRCSPSQSNSQRGTP